MFATLELLPEPASVRVARRWSLEVLAAHGLEELGDTIVLLVSELVSNAVQHAATPCTLRIDCGGPVRVEVLDASDEMPEPSANVDPLAASGRGLHLVATLSSSFGADLLVEGGKRVWFELPVPGGSLAAPPSATSSTA